MGRTNHRSTKAAKSGTRGVKACSIETRQPFSVGTIRHVTSIPFVAPATWTNRSRSVSGSFQVLASHVTGRPSPRRSMRGRRATILAITDPSAPGDAMTRTET